LSFFESQTRLKDNAELEGDGTKGTLNIGSLTAAHTGTYTCVAETEAGTSKSEGADITIYGNTGFVKLRYHHKHILI